METVLAAIWAEKAIWMPALAVIVAWLMPSPLKAAATAQAAVQAAETKADGPDHDVTDLDEIP